MNNCNDSNVDMLHEILDYIKDVMFMRKCYDFDEFLNTILELQPQYVSWLLENPAHVNAVVAYMDAARNRLSR